MPKIDISDKRKIYYQIEGEGTPIVLLHGLLGSSQDWYIFGYIQDLKRNFKVISIDLIGHGKSSKPHNEDAYEYEKQADDVIALLNFLNLPKAHILGFSHGGRVAFAVGKYHQDRVISLILGAIHIYPRSDLSNINNINKRIDLLKSGVPSYIKHIEELGNKLTPSIKKILLKNDANAIIANLNYIRHWKGMESTLKDIIVPVLFYVGDKDNYYEGAKKCSETIQHSIFISLPDSDHIQSLMEKDVILHQILRFLEEVAK
ncbi:MAG: alpha/beta fold hydrolase [Candidatus Kariarchaeaceae archaeon]|jgi:pimeloyl-ACP methyl ester carboxylesterase